MFLNCCHVRHRNRTLFSAISDLSPLVRLAIRIVVIRRLLLLIHVQTAFVRSARGCGMVALSRALRET
jgi:hypothetical protein